MAEQLIQYAVMTPDLKRRGVVEIFAKKSPIIEELFFIDLLDAMGYEYDVEGALPGIGFRALNGDYDSQGAGVVNPVKEGTSIMGGLVTADHRKAKNAAYKASRIAMKIKAASAYFTKMFFDGSTKTDARQFDGLNRRLKSANIKYAGANGGVLDLDDLSEMIDRVPGAAGEKRLLMGSAMRRRLGSLIRAAGATVIAMAEWEGEIKPKSFDGVPIVLIGEDESGNEILDFDETRGNSSVTGSIYCVRFGQDTDGEYLQGIANHAAAGVFEIDEQGVRGTTDQTLVEGQVGLVLQHPKCAVRYAGILDANS